MKRREALAILGGLTLFPSMAFAKPEPDLSFHIMMKYGWGKRFDFNEALGECRPEKLESLYVQLVRLSEYHNYDFILFPKEIAKYMEDRWEWIQNSNPPKKNCIRQMGSSSHLGNIWGMELNNVVILGRTKKVLPERYLKNNMLYDYIDCPRFTVIHLKNSPFDGCG